jgi:riboflavin synthase
MFTGIIEEIGTVIASPAGKLVIAGKKTLEGIQPGGSISVNGACQTVIDFNGTGFTVEVMPETLKRTNLGELGKGDKVNLERPMALGGEVGGHLVQGHVDDTGRIISAVREGDAVLIRIEAPADLMQLIVTKGFIAVDGASLTVVDKDNTSFRVSIVGYTQQNITLVDKKVGDTVNLEADIIGKYVAEFNKAGSGGITAEFLQEHGFAAN